jgi:geranylgeranylglycerol-phosphate geranylgeranyltransferase
MEARSYRVLVDEGRRWLGAVARGHEPLVGMPLGRFLGVLTEAVRLHFFAFGAGAALAGAAAVSSSPGPLRVALAAFVAGAGWGVGQLINDVLDRDTDAVNAPGRPVADGRLPVGPTLAVALASGLGLLVAMLAIHPAAWVLAPAAVVLLVGYNAAKSLPLLGNVAHGAIASVAGAMGVMGALPEEADSLADALAGLASAWRMLVAILAIDAWFLLSNYEKDRVGDRAAGYRTLPLLIGIRACALIRALLAVALAASVFWPGAVPTLPGKVALLVAAAVGVLSTLPPLVAGTEEAALRGYRLAVPASFIAMIGLAAPLLGALGLLIATLASLAVVELTLRRTRHL